ncbi:multidrug transporter [Altererythrobacter aerius]|uniref:Multidrug transporter n=1 Tax=Tsuneonella aeria TaxID=1837929 RepID=A0A6I4T8G9_9SPHN|nr:SapC family protein [Tsuneonella aeria]MXO73869.1 multidrug transporter [Tsuneonella aeria]
MASAPQTTLPLFYNDLMPLNSRDHVNYRVKRVDGLTWLVNQHAVPLTSDEFIQAQRDYPIVFSSGEGGVPLALMGLNEGVNAFVGDDGKLTEDVYVPAYARRYPYLLARLTPEAEELSLCFDPTSKAIGEFKDGDPLFDSEGKPGQPIQSALDFCEQFEQAGARTQALIEELNKHDLLMDGEIAITANANPEKPYIYRGFKMVNEEKLRDLDAETAKTWVANGIMAIIFAHLFSLQLMSNVFSRQMAQGKVPEGQPEPAA